MPSPMSANNDDALGLTNEEIETLYDIVRHAQTLPGPPFRALFRAYDTVRARRGGTDDGSRFFTFLYRMQDENVAADESLVHRFQRVLADMGIEVECHSDGEGIEVTTNLDLLSHNGDSTRNQTGRVPSRRGSFDSFFDGAADKVPGTDGGQDVYARSRRSSHVDESEMGKLWEKRRSRSDTDASVNFPRQLPFRSRPIENMNRRAVPAANPARPRRSGSVSSQGSLRIHRTGRFGIGQAGGYDGDESEQSDSFERSQIQIPGVNAPIPGIDDGSAQRYARPDIHYRPSDTQIESDADTFNHQRISAVARSCMQKLNTRVQYLHERNDTALAFERSVLLPASLESWRIALQNKRQQLETERFFGRLEGRADKARNLFLMTKALTHWAKSAEDEVQRTSVARRHILRTKFFNAWRDITAVNEFKIQHFILAKFLNKWRNRLSTVQENDDLALDLYRHNIVYKLYWRWFWRFCDREAPVWHDTKLERNMFEKWVENVGILQEKKTWASNRRDHQVARKAFGALCRKRTLLQSTSAQADEFRDSALLSSAFKSLRKQAQLNPSCVQFKSRANDRLLRFVLQKWNRNTQMSRQATTVDRLRVLHTAFTSWNDRLRIKALEDQINDRLKVESVYKWALAGRVQIFRRVQDQRLKRSTFSNWVSRTVQQNNALQVSENRFLNFKRDQMLRSCLLRIEGATIEKRNQELLARSVYEAKLKQKIMSKMVEKHEYLQQLDQWAERASWYLGVKHTLKRLSTATEHARRNRRRENYAHIRRTVKMNLARRTLRILNDTAVLRANRNQVADEMIDHRTRKNAGSLLLHWHDRSESYRTFQTQADWMSNSNVLVQHLSTWVDESRHVQVMNKQATALRQESTEIAASGSLKKFSWRLFERKRRDETALAFHQRTFNKHVRAMLRFWWDQTSDKLVQKAASPTPSTRSRVGWSRLEHEQFEHAESANTAIRPQAEIDEPVDDTEQLEAWTAFDEGALGVSDLDLSLSVVPPRRPLHQAIPFRARTQPPLRSALRPPPIPEMPDLEEDDAAEFWTSTPMPIQKAGYLKTPSKRSIARSKRPELPVSPEKRAVVAMSAPPGQGYALPGGLGTRGVTSFERRLREGGFNRSVRGSGSRESRLGNHRVEFSDLGDG